MKTNLLILLLLCFSSFVMAQQTAVKTLDAQKCPNIKVKVPNKLIQHKAWDEGGIRIDITIKSDLPNEVLQALLKAGRYELSGKKDSNDFFITAPNMDISLSIDGNKIQEEILINISTPEYIVMNDRAELYKDINEQVIRSRSDTREELEAVLQRMKAIREDINVHIQVVSTSAHKNIDLTTFMLMMNNQEVAVDKISFPSVGE